MQTQVVDAFERLAELTWKRLHYGHILGCTQSEETITDVNLLDLKMLNSPDIRVYKGTKSEEAICGFDWEWWIGSDSSGWWRYAVQAKRLKLPDYRYSSLRHFVPKSGRFQIDLLDAYAKQHNAIPLYCFYNCVEEWEARLGWHCPLPFEQMQLGCTIVPLHIVRCTHQYGETKSFRNLHISRYALPWRCLVKCDHIIDNSKPNARNRLALFNRAVTNTPTLPPALTGVTDEPLALELLADWYRPVYVEREREPFEIQILPEKILVVDIGERQPE